jgi:hypothetical protein
MKTTLIVGGVIAVLGGMAVLAAAQTRKAPALPASPPPAPVATAQTKAARAVKESVDLIPIVHLEMQDRIVTIQSGRDGLAYLVKAKDGKVLHESLSEDQLKAQAPEIHDLIKTSVAGNGSKDHSFLDARN